MKNKGFFVGALLGIAACMVIQYLAMLIDMNPVQMTMIFVIPVGGLIYGMIIGFGARQGMIMDNQSCKTWHKIVVGICGIFSIAAATYLDYATYYATAEGPNRLFKGVHISEGLGLDFPRYFESVYRSSGMTLRFKGGTEIPIDSETFVVIVYILQYIGAAIAAFLTLSTIYNKPKCPNCDKYYKTKEVDRFVTSISVDEVVAEVNKELAEDRFYTPHYLKSANHTYSVRVHYCKDCREGLLEIMIRRGSGRNTHYDTVGSYKIGETELFKFQLVD